MKIALLIPEFCLFVVTIGFVPLYVAWRERRMRKDFGPAQAAPRAAEQPLSFSTALRLAMAAEPVNVEPAHDGPSFTTADQKLRSQVNQLLASRR